MGWFDDSFKRTDKWFESLEHEEPTQQEWLWALQAHVGSVHRLARRYNAVLLFLACFFALLGLSYIPGHYSRFDVMFVGLGFVGVSQVGIAVAIVFLKHAWGCRRIESITWGIFSVIPLFGLYVASRVIWDVMMVMEKAGFRPVWYGFYKQIEIDRLLNPFVCTNCSYDLTGNESGRCPECGEPVCGDTTESVS